MVAAVAEVCQTVFKRFSMTEVIPEFFSQVTVEAEVHMAVPFDF